MSHAAIDAGAAQAAACAAVARSGTSFAAGMAILPRARRDAMHAIYAFCREVDDIADDLGLDAPERMRRLAEWRREIDRVYAGAPQTTAGAALVPAVSAYDLPRAEFVLMIEGMEMDAGGPIVAPPFEILFAYTRRVAGSVGLLSMPVFGAPPTQQADQFALALGDALQLTNILRDVEEDAAIGRVYLPAEALARRGVDPQPEAVAADKPALAAVRRDLAGVARDKFAAARGFLAAFDWRTARPALLMMGVYEATLDRMEREGFTGPARLSRLDKALVAARWFAAPKLVR
jgi:phytoene synthase